MNIRRILIKLIMNFLLITEKRHNCFIVLVDIRLLDEIQFSIELRIVSFERESDVFVFKMLRMC